MQAGVVVGEQQIVLGREVAIEGPQRHPGVGGDLLGRRVLDALGEEPHHRRLPQRLAGALAARRLGRPDHVRKVPHVGYVNIDKTRIGGDTPHMVALLVHAILGIAVVAFIVKSNPDDLQRVPAARSCRRWRSCLWAVGIASLPLCWYFNIRFVYEYARPEPDSGARPAGRSSSSWGTRTPRASSQVQDYTIVNVILLPLFTIIDGRRRGIRRPWLFFVSSLFTSFAFAWAFYFATIERQRRHQQAAVPVLRLYPPKERPSSRLHT